MRRLQILHDLQTNGSLRYERFWISQMAC